MDQKRGLIIRLTEIDREDSNIAGEYAVQLAECKKAQIPIPDGFVVTGKAYYKFIKENDLTAKITHILIHVDYSQPESLLAAANKIRNFIENSPLSPELLKTIFAEYKRLNGILHNDTFILHAGFIHDEYSGLSQESSRKNISTASGEANLIICLKTAWSSLFSAEAIFFRHERKISHFKTGIAVIIQKQFPPQFTGSLFTVNTASNDKTKITLSAVFGIAENSENNDNIADYYEISKRDLLIIKKIINPQKSYLQVQGSHRKTVPVSSDKQIRQKIPNQQILALAAIGKRLENLFYFPMECKWIIHANKIYITDFRPVTYHPQKKQNQYEQNPEKKQTTSKTATKVNVLINAPESAEIAAGMNADGVGLLNIENLIISNGVHPKQLINSPLQTDLTTAISAYVSTVARAFSPKPVILCASDLTSHILRNFPYGKSLEPTEINSLIGYHGLFRHLHESVLFNLEISVIKKLRNKENLTNISLMLPFIRTTDELLDCKKILAVHGLHRSPTFKLWMRLDIPANIISLAKFIDSGIDGVTIGADILTKLILGTDTENEEVVSAYNPLDDAVISSFEKIIKTANTYNIQSSISGHILTLYPSLTEKFTRWGISSVTVLPALAEQTREIIARVERRIIMK